MKVAVLCSGGMDSTVALYDAARHHEVLAVISCDYGAKHNPKEIPLAAHHARLLKLPHRILPLHFIRDLFTSNLLTSGGEIPEGDYDENNMRQTVVPFRNGIMLAAAAGLAESIGAEGVVIGAHGGDHAIYPDCREDFMQAMQTAIEKGTYARVQLLRPFINADKSDIARRGAELQVDFAQTWSCYKGGDLHCCTCATCLERQNAFITADVTDPTEYLKPVANI